MRMPVASYYYKYNDGRWRTIELGLIADYSMLYEPIQFRTPLVWTDIWADGDRVFVDQQKSDDTMESFCAFRDKIKHRYPNDVLILLTNTRFTQGHGGKGYLASVCRGFAVGIVMDVLPSPLSVASVLAHEIGHTLGLNHDYVGCACESVDRICIMSASAIEGKPLTVWSECSLRELRYHIPYLICLYNRPSKTDDTARCGNNVVEFGEQCDCGSEFACVNPCCNPRTCKFVGAAKCAIGSCCNRSTCTLKPAGTVCRKKTNSCDLPEYCNGRDEVCPANYYLQDGSYCSELTQNFCYNGKCGDPGSQCKAIFGSQARHGSGTCYQLNMYGTASGHCYKRGGRYTACAPNNVYCGRLHCENVEMMKTLPGGLQHLYTTMDNTICHVAFPYVEGGPDPGYVVQGANCGQNKDDTVPFYQLTFREGTDNNAKAFLCVAQRCSTCQNCGKALGSLYGNSENRFLQQVLATSLYVSVCEQLEMCYKRRCEDRSKVTPSTYKCQPENCNGVGVCNNVGHCHCRVGYGGKSCSVTGPGGSLDSGPASYQHGYQPVQTRPVQQTLPPTRKTYQTRKPQATYQFQQTQPTYYVQQTQAPYQTQPIQQTQAAFANYYQNLYNSYMLYGQAYPGWYYQTPAQIYTPPASGYTRPVATYQTYTAKTTAFTKWVPLVPPSHMTSTQRSQKSYNNSSFKNLRKNFGLDTSVFIFAIILLLIGIIIFGIFSRKTSKRLSSSRERDASNDYSQNSDTIWYSSPADYSPYHSAPNNKGYGYRGYSGRADYDDNYYSVADPVYDTGGWTGASAYGRRYQNFYYQ